MTVFVTVTGDKRISNKIIKVGGKLKAPRLILTRIGRKLVTYFKENMVSEGVKLTKQRWKELSPATAAAKSRLGFGGKKILERTGKLKKAIKTLSVTSHTVTIGNKTPYYKFHQLGGKKIPKRKQLGVNNDVNRIVMTEIMKDISFR